MYKASWGIDTVATAAGSIEELIKPSLTPGYLTLRGKGCQHTMDAHCREKRNLRYHHRTGVAGLGTRWYFFILEYSTVCDGNVGTEHFKLDAKRETVR